MEMSNFNVDYFIWLFFAIDFSIILQSFIIMLFRVLEVESYIYDMSFRLREVKSESSSNGLDYSTKRLALKHENYMSQAFNVYSSAESLALCKKYVSIFFLKRLSYAFAQLYFLRSINVEDSILV